MKEKMIIKVCGMRDAHNIREVEALGVDWIGMIFYPRSPRYVSTVPADGRMRRAKRVAVFVDAPFADICKTVRVFSFDLVQLHGKESPQLCRNLREALPGVKIVKAFSVKDADSLLEVAQYEGLADYYLFDTHCGDARGGSGRTFDHAILQGYTGSTPFLLSGGLSPDNAVEVKSFTHPMLAGYDLNSCFETAPALKDPTLIRQFLEKIKEI